MEHKICKHYNRHCSFVSPCCKKIYPCRLCHDEVENHNIDRYLVKQVKCNDCETIQKVQQACEKCDKVFGAYFCEKCRLYDDDTDKGQFHCEACGLCRIGGKSNFFHCEKCDICLGVSLKDKHKCVEKTSRANCPVCMEDLHTSTEAVTVPKCTHLLHKKCYDECLKTGNYTCPTCGVSLLDMKQYWGHLDEEIASTPMPDEYKDTYIHSLCKDCHKVTKCLFHVLGQKCQKCGSYNTCGSDAQESNDSSGDESDSPSTGANTVTGAENTTSTGANAIAGAENTPSTGANAVTDMENSEPLAE